MRTCARCGATMVFEEGAVFALIVFGTFTIVVRRQIKALRSVLTGTAFAVVNVQLENKGE